MACPFRDLGLRRPLVYGAGRGMFHKIGFGEVWTRGGCFRYTGAVPRHDPASYLGRAGAAPLIGPRVKGTEN